MVSTAVSCSQEKEGHTEKKQQSPVQSEREAVLVGTLNKLPTLAQSFYLFFFWILLSDFQYFLWEDTVCTTKEPKCECIDMDFSIAL